MSLFSLNFIYKLFEASSNRLWNGYVAFMNRLRDYLALISFWNYFKKVLSAYETVMSRLWNGYESVKRLFSFNIIFELF